MTVARPVPTAPGILRPARLVRVGLAVGVAWVVAWGMASWAMMPTVAADPVVGQQVTTTDWVTPVVYAVVVGVGGLVLVRDRRHRYGWLLFVAPLVLMPAVFCGLYALHGQYVSADPTPVAPAAAWFQDLTTMPWMVVVVLLLPGLFPDGHVVAGRWGQALRVALGCWIALIVAWMLTERPLENWFLDLPDIPDNATGVLALPVGALQGAWLLTMVASAAIAIGSVRRRWRDAGPELRQQMKWPLLAFVLTAAWIAADMANTLLVEVLEVDLGLSGPIRAAGAGTALAFAVGLGLGVLRYRLYDVDRVINRTVVYGVLTVGVTAVYVLVVVGIGSLIPDASDRGLALAATVIVAVAFEPARRRLQSVANRVVFGQRDEPYVVLARLGEAMVEAGDPSETLQTVAGTVARSLKLPWAAIELVHRDGQVERVEHGAQACIETEAASVSLPLIHADEQVGRLLVAPRSVDEPLGRADRRILADIAHHTAAVAATARLTLDLRRSREHLVLAREDERRRIRRDLHDGLGPTLAAHTLALDAAADRVARDPAGALELLGELKRGTQELISDIRRLVHDLRPPALDELGLAGALVAHVAHLDDGGAVAVRIRTEPDPLPELSAAVEVAAWRIAQEAITNVLRHADARSCTISLRIDGQNLEVRVVDDGLGMPVVPQPGLGLASMHERAAELGGTLTVTDASTGGTEVLANLPLRVQPRSTVGSPSPPLQEWASDG